MAFDVFKAIRFTEYYARETRWPAQMHKVFGVLGFVGRYPTAKEFVTAVHRWQLSHPPLGADGVLGVQTWRAMAPAVQAYKTVAAPAARRPDWLKFVNELPAPKGAANPPAARPAMAAQTGESLKDKLLKEMIETVIKMGEDPYPAYPVSYKQLANATQQMMLVIDPPSLMVPPIRIGQVWPGLAGGTRIVLAIQPYRTTAVITFITDSGRLYQQSMKGWVKDYEASVWANVNANLAPIQTLLEVEAKFLMGMISALHPGAAAFIFAMNTMQFIAVNRQPLGKIVDVMPDFLLGLATIKLLAPTLFERVIMAVARQTVTSIPSTIASDPKIMAFLIGQLIVTVGRLVFLRDVSPLVGIVVPVIKRVVLALGQNAHKFVLPAGAAAAKAVPGALKDAAKELAKELVKANVSLNVQDSEAIVLELYRNRDQLQKVLPQVQSSATELVKALQQLKSP